MIEWIDSLGCSPAWTDLGEDFERTPLLCRSVGWLFRDEEDYKIIIPHLVPSSPASTQQGCGDMTIPSCCIRKMHTLSEDDIEKTLAEKTVKCAKKVLHQSLGDP